jgi:hypothetical protein
MEVGKPVRVLKGIDLGAEGKVEKGAVGILESMSNSVYMPFLVKFPQGTFAFEDGEIEDVPETQRENGQPANNLKKP